MELFNIEATGTTPKVYLDSNKRVIEISGYSRPENVRSFYEPILKWISSYRNELAKIKSNTKQAPTTVVDFNLGYFNSSSAKFICDIIIMLRDINSDGFEVNVNWHYDPIDSEMLEAGEELSGMSDFKFSYIAN